MAATRGKMSGGIEGLYRVLKILAAWAMTAVIALAGYLMFPVVSQYVSLLQFVTIIAVLNALATTTLWSEAARRPPRPNKEFLQKLLHSEPITPQHNPPQVVGGKYSSVATDADRRFFADFAEFAHVVNLWLAPDKYVGSSWRLQELPDGTVRLNVDFSDGPILGRCYEIFHNQIWLGRLEICPGNDYSAATPNVITEIELDNVRLLSYESIAGFLRTIAMFVCEQDPKSMIILMQTKLSSLRLQRLSGRADE